MKIHKLLAALALCAAVPCPLLAQSLSVTPASLGNFTTANGSGSASQPFTLNGSGIAGTVTVTAPSGFQVSLDNSTFSSSLTVARSGGTIQSVGNGFVAITSNGSVVTWGDVGNSSSVAGSLSSNVTAVYSNGGAFAALKRNGSVVTWGDVGRGGNSSSVAGSLSSNVTAVYSNNRAFAALKRNGSVVTWGDAVTGGNSSIYTGLGRDTDNGAIFYSETSVAGNLSSNVTAVYSNGNAFAALKSDGSVVTWGLADSGGDSSIATYIGGYSTWIGGIEGHPFYYTSVAGSLSSNVTAVYSNGAAFAALKNNGSVVTWGHSWYGGDSSSVSASLSSNVTAVYSNGSAFAALKSNGSLVTWGDVGSGGNSSIATFLWQDDYAPAVYSETSVAGNLSSNVTAVYSNGSAFAALKSDGSLVTWGDVGFGGNSSIATFLWHDYGSPAVYSETSVAGNLSSNVTAVYSNNGAFAALKSNGSVVTWGDVGYGADSSSVSGSLSSNVTAVYSNNGAFAALKSNGSVVTWGDSRSGGDSSSVSASLSSNVTAVYSNGSAFAALKSDGSVVTWGDASRGGSGGPANIGAAGPLAATVYVRIAPTAPPGSVSGNITLASAGAANQTVALSGTVTVPTPTITSAASANGTIGIAFSYQIVASGNSSNYTATGLPTGVTLNATTGLISGTPTAFGNFSVKLGARNSFGTGNATLALAIARATTVTSNATASGTHGMPFSYQITASNPPLVSYRVTGTLPAGTTWNATTGVIAGTPTVSGNFNISVTANNTFGSSAAKPVAIQIAPAPLPVIASFGTVGNVAFQAYNTRPAPVLAVTANNPGNNPLTYQWFKDGVAIAGATGTTYNPGAASTATVGSYHVVLRNAGNQTLTSPMLAFNLVPAATFAVSRPVNQSFTAGANATFSVSSLGGLPSGNATVAYQWYRNGEAISGATSSSYTVPGGMSSATAGSYAVDVTTSVGGTVIGTVRSASWAFTPQDSGILVYNLSGRAARTIGANETTSSITGYVVVDRTNNNAAIIHTYGTGFGRRNSLEMRSDIAAATTGPVRGSRTVLAGSLNSGDNPVDHDIVWVSGLDSEVILPATTTAPILPEVRLFAPLSLSGFMGILVRNASSVEIENYSVTLSLNTTLTANSYRNGQNFNQAIAATRSAATTAGFLNAETNP